MFSYLNGLAYGIDLNIALLQGIFRVISLVFGVTKGEKESFSSDFQGHQQMFGV